MKVELILISGHLLHRSLSALIVDIGSLVGHIAVVNLCWVLYFAGGSSSVVSFTQCSPTCGRMPLPALSLWPGRQPYRPRLVGGRRGGGP